MSEKIIESSRRLAREVSGLRFSPPVTHVYNPLDYARVPHEKYLSLYGTGHKRVLFLGMNPGPWGMAQTGVPFGEVPAVRDWMRIQTPVGKPKPEHPKRPVQGFDCVKSEVSGRRLWGLFKARFGHASDFFRDHFVANYCPLVFMSETGANITPDKVPAYETAALFAACDRHLQVTVETLRVEWLVAVGNFAGERLKNLFGGSLKMARILHPSPASPLANKDWAGTATRQMLSQCVWAD